MSGAVQQRAACLQILKVFNTLPAQPPWAGAAFSIASLSFTTVVSLHSGFLEHVKCCQIGSRRRRREVCSSASGSAVAGKSKECFLPCSGAFRERLVCVCGGLL